MITNVEQTQLLSERLANIRSSLKKLLLNFQKYFTLLAIMNSIVVRMIALFLNYARTFASYLKTFIS